MECVGQEEVSRLYLKGRYLKLRRGISQTPFVLRDGQVMAETSVEAIVVEKLRRFVTGGDIKFIPAGREDLDVRMLGTGRPFVLEIKHPSPPSLTPYPPPSLTAI